MKNILGIFAALAFSNAYSTTVTFTPLQLAQLVKSPEKFNPTTTDKTQNLSGGVPIYQYEWNDYMPPEAIQFRLLAKNSKQWELVVFEASFPIKQIAPKKTLLATTHVAYTAKDTGAKMEELSYLYLIADGPLKGKYLNQEINQGIGNRLTISTKDYGKISVQVIPLGPDSAVSTYPVADYNYNKAAFCKLKYVKCN